MQWGPGALEEYDALDTDLIHKNNTEHSRDEDLATSVYLRKAQMAVTLATIAAAVENPTAPVVTKELMHQAGLYVKYRCEDLKKALNLDAGTQTTLGREHALADRIRHYIADKCFAKSGYNVPADIAKMENKEEARITLSLSIMKKLVKNRPEYKNSLNKLDEVLTQQLIPTLIDQQILQPVAYTDDTPSNKLRFTANTTTLERWLKDQG